MNVTETVHQITRINPRSGYREYVWFHGPKSGKPKGWSFTGKFAHNYDH